jgi:hypothetical protein
VIFPYPIPTFSIVISHNFFSFIIRSASLYGTIFFILHLESN